MHIFSWKLWLGFNSYDAYERYCRDTTSTSFIDRRSGKSPVCASFTEGDIFDYGDCGEFPVFGKFTNDFASSLILLFPGGRGERHLLPFFAREDVINNQ